MKKVIFVFIISFALSGISFAQREVDKCFDYLDAGDYQRAIETAKKGVKSTSNNLYTHKCLGMAYYEIGEFSRSVSSLKEAEQLATGKSDLLSIYNLLGRAFYGVADYDDALLISIGIFPYQGI